MNDLVAKIRIEGQVLYDDVDIYGKDVDVVELRKRIGMVFQKPNPFPMSIYDNIAYGPRIHGQKNVDKIVVRSLKESATLGRVSESWTSLLWPIRRAAAEAMHRQDPGHAAGCYFI